MNNADKWRSQDAVTWGQSGKMTAKSRYQKSESWTLNFGQEVVLNELVEC